MNSPPTPANRTSVLILPLSETIGDGAQQQGSKAQANSHQKHFGGPALTVEPFYVSKPGRSP